VPFIGQWGERRGQAVSGQTLTGGALITRRLHEDEATGQRPFKGEMKRR
jgi:hypothetical protein